MIRPCMWNSQQFTGDPQVDDSRRLLDGVFQRIAHKKLAAQGILGTLVRTALLASLMWSAVARAQQPSFFQQPFQPRFLAGGAPLTH